MRTDVSSPMAGGDVLEQPETTPLIDAFAPPSAPMTMQVRALEVSWAERLRFAPARPALSPAGR